MNPLGIDVVDGIPDRARSGTKDIECCQAKAPAGHEGERHSRRPEPVGFPQPARKRIQPPECRALYSHLPLGETMQ